MALFKISKGLKNNLPSNKIEGYCYFTTDDGKFHIDVSNSQRITINAEKADKDSNGKNIADEYIHTTAKVYGNSTTLHAETMTINEHAQIQYDSNNQCMNFIFI